MHLGRVQVAGMDRNAPVEWRVTNSLALIEDLEKYRPPSDGVRALEYGAGENVVQWCLGGRLVRHESPIEVQHAQKSAVLTDGLGRGQSWRRATRSSRGWDFSADTLYPRKVTAGDRKAHFSGLMMIPYL
jgi:hypothetical protein